jgi:hypothetical protein
VRLSRREALAAGAGAMLAWPAAAGAQRRDDGDILVDLIAREEAAALAGGEFAAQESEHAAALRTHLDALGRRLPDPVREADGAESAEAREQALIAAYRRALLELDEPSILKTAGTILASHAGHHALITKAVAAGPR